MSQEHEALELLEKVSETLTDLAIKMEPGELRGKLVAVSEDIDAFMYEAEEPLEDEMVTDEYEDDDEYDQEAGGANFDWIDDDDDEGEGEAAA